jgi:Protein of unknown function (DUF3303)
MLGRWDGMDGKGFAISESTDPKAMYRWTAQWADLLPLTVTPCLEDADAGEVMASLPGVGFSNPIAATAAGVRAAVAPSRAGEHPLNPTGS